MYLARELSRRSGPPPMSKSSHSRTCALRDATSSTWQTAMPLSGLTPGMRPIEGSHAPDTIHTQTLLRPSERDGTRRVPFRGSRACRPARDGTPPPEGVAVVLAAFDWYRAGLLRPAPVELSLKPIQRATCPATTPTLVSRFDAGLAWASTSVSGARLLTHRTDGSGVTVHDYVLDYLSEVLPIRLSPASWDAIESHLRDSPEGDCLLLARPHSRSRPTWRNA